MNRALAGVFLLGVGCSPARVVDRGGDCGTGGCFCNDDAECGADETCVQGTCVPLACGNGSLDANETCDDGNTRTEDGCSFRCVIEPGFACLGEPSLCERICGDATLDAEESCDDGNLESGDGCTDCRVDAAWKCDPGEPSQCYPACGDGVVDGTEACDDGNEVAADGCTGCAIDVNWACTDSDPSECRFSCGDGVPDPSEECDDGNGDDCDGCRAGCVVGCVCANGFGCVVGAWCNAGGCEACDTAGHCGGGCVACTGATPICGGVAVGCVCDPSPTPNGSCGVAARCEASGACASCDSATYCGSACGACASPTSVCGGTGAGCVAPSCTGLPDFTPCLVVTTPDRDFDICSDELCVSPGVGTYTDGVDRTGTCLAGSTAGEWTCNTPRTHIVAPDTSQRRCYDVAGATVDCTACDEPTPPVCGQDAQHGWDTSHSPAARFTKTESVADEPVVVDNVTGLRWQGCAAGQRGVSCTGTARQLSYAAALAECEASPWGGSADWRLPDIFELQSLVDYSRAEPALDPVVFPLPAGASFSTSTASYQYPGWAFMVDFSSSETALLGMSGGYSLRCVRGAIAAVPVRFLRDTTTVPDQPVVIDQITGLMWQGCPRGRSGPSCATTAGAAAAVWATALLACQDLDWGGYTDWVLPDADQLFSLTHGYLFNPAVEPSTFPETAGMFWSATTDPLYPDDAHPVSLNMPGVGGWNQHKTYSNGVLCVRVP